MSFLSIDEIILFIWGIATLHFVFRWMKKWKGSDDSSTETHHEESGYPIPDASLPKPSPYASGEDDDKEYDYKELRERVLRSWGMKEAKSDEMDLPDQMERSVYREKVAFTEVSAERSVEGAENSFQQYLSRHSRENEIKPTAVETVTVPVTAKTAANWSEETVRTWMRYDVVLGEPRVRKPWTPFVRN